MASRYYYPSGIYAQEQPLWLNFYAAPYSLRNFERTRAGVVDRAQIHIQLPMPKEPGYQIQHNFGESNNNPVGPILTRAGVANMGGNMFGEGGVQMLSRMLQPMMFFHERMFATSTYRRFSNIAEATMISEGRKQYFFQYILVPKTPEESLQVEQIVGSFRKASYPQVADLPERTYPQGLWTMAVTKGNVPAFGGEGNLTANWLGEPLVCVLQNVFVKKNDDADSVVRYLPNGASSVTLLGLLFTEFETGTYAPGIPTEYGQGQILSKSEISTAVFGQSL